MLVVVAHQAVHQGRHDGDDDGGHECAPEAGNVEACAIENETAKRVTLAIRDIMARWNMEPYDEDAGTGFVRHAVVLMVSGGSDSTALAYLGDALREAGDVGPVAMLHVNHQLRGEDADADERFVAA